MGASRPEIWVGSVEFDRRSIFVRFELRAADLVPMAYVDLPSLQALRTPVAVASDGDRLEMSFQVRDDRWVINVLEGDATLSGSAKSGEARGRVALNRTVDFDPSLLLPYVGAYTSPAGTQVMLGIRPSDGDWNETTCFYLDGDCIVQLFPISESRFVSSRGEEIELAGPDAVGQLAIRWRQGDRCLVAVRVRNHREREVRFPSGEVQLAGTLLIPGRADPGPGVVLAHGTFPAQRHFYRVFAEAFVSSGVSALIFDKRGYGSSLGNQQSTIAERADDLEAAIKFLQLQPEVDVAQVGLWGFSNSTWSLPIVACRLGSRLAFLVAIGAAGVSMARAEAFRKSAELQSLKVDEKTVRTVRRAWEIIYEYLSAGIWDDAWETELPQLLDQVRASEELSSIPIPAVVQANPMLTPIPPALDIETFRSTMGGQLPDMAYDPVTDYRHVSCPVLFLVGASDASIPAQESVAAVVNALHAGGNADFEARVIPGAGHYLNQVSDDVIGLDASDSGRQLLNFCFVPGMRKYLVDWVVERMARVRT